jgi:hypothetical protein
VFCSQRVDETVYLCYGTDQKIRAGFDDHLARATMATVDSDVSFEWRLQWPSRSSFCSREDHRLTRTRQIRDLIAPQEEAVQFSFSRSVWAGAVVDPRQFRMPAGHIRPALPGHMGGLLADALKTRSHTRPPFFSSLGWTIIEPPEIRVTIAIVVPFSSSMSWTICPSTSAEPISCSKVSPPVMKSDRSC